MEPENALAICSELEQRGFNFDNPILFKKDSMILMNDYTILAIGRLDRKVLQVKLTEEQSKSIITFLSGGN